jgi:hypothetical protein
MPKKYEVNDIFDVKGVEKFLKSTNKALLEMEKTIRDIGKSKIIPKGDGGDLQKINKDLEALNSTRKESIAINKEAEKRIKSIQRNREKSNVEIQKNIQLQKEKNKEATNEAKAQIALDKAQKRGIKTLQDLEKVTNALVKRRKQLDLSTKNGIKQYKKLTNEISRNTNKLKKYDKAIGRSFRNVGNYTGALKNLAGAFGIAFGARVVVDFFRDSLQGYEDQIIAEQKLETVLKQRTGATTEQINKIKELTAEQQKQGIIGDEIQIAGAQQLSTFVGQTKSVETLIPAMNNLIAQQKGFAATQGDATNIANLMGKALQGQLGALTRVGISFTEAQGEILKFGNEQERSAVLAEVITGNVGEMNKSLADTPLGKMQQLKNVFGDIKEQIGGATAGVLFRFASFLRELIDVLSGPNNLTDSLKDTGDAFQGMIDSTSKLIKIFGGLKETGNEAKNTINGIGFVIDILLTPIRALIKWTGYLVDAFTFVLEKGRQLLEYLNILDKQERLRREEQEKLLKAEAERQKQIAAYTERLKELNKTTEANTEINKRNTKSKKEQNKELITQEQILKDIDEAIKSFEVADTDFDIIGDIDKTAKARIDIAIANFEKQQALEKQGFFELASSEQLKTQFAKEQADELFEYKVLKEIEYLEFLKRTRLEGNKVAQANLESQIEILKASLAEFKAEVSPEGEEKPFSIWSALGLDEKQAEQANEILQLSKQVLSEYFDTQIQKYDELAKKSQENIKNIENELKAEEERNDKGAASRITSLKKQLAAEQERERQATAAKEKAAKRQKQVSIFEAVVGTAVGVVNSLKSGGILGIILAALVAAAGAIQIAKIKSAKFATGTEYLDLNGNPKGTDTIPAMANGQLLHLDEGERIFSNKQNKRIPKGMSNEEATAILANYGTGYDLLDGKNSFVLNQSNSNFANNKELKRELQKSNRFLDRIANKPDPIYDKDGKVKGYKQGDNIVTWQ